MPFDDIRTPQQRYDDYVNNEQGQEDKSSTLSLKKVENYQLQAQNADLAHLLYLLMVKEPQFETITERVDRVLDSHDE